jgi:hypothetical protein
MTPPLGNICPWMAVTSKKSLDQLFNLEFDMFVLTPIHFVETCMFLAVAVQNQIATTPHQRSRDRPDSTQMQFLSEKTLHIVDRVLWMLPFAANTDLNEAAKKADIRHESRNGFLQMLLDEHSIIGARQQLKEHWGK